MAKQHGRHEDEKPVIEQIAGMEKPLNDVPTYKWLAIESAPVDGSHVYLSADAKGDGQLCYARPSRRSVNFRWEQVRIWSDINTRLAVNFTPKYWRAA